MLETENLQSLIDSGEGYYVEFKVRVPSKVRELRINVKTKSHSFLFTQLNGESLQI